MNTAINPSTQALVEQALESIRPFLQKDGGDVELIDILHDTEVHIRLHGSCANCLMSNMTLKNGIEESVRRLAPHISKIVEVKAG
ncbi:MAG: NifU family protein [Bacteroidetes bacterium]|jgi:Fe-S cluster biogenesis protein NfuA|nr:NifU family protein [Bacteroidota bacterium]